MRTGNTMARQLRSLKHALAEACGYVLLMVFVAYLVSITAGCALLHGGATSAEIDAAYTSALMGCEATAAGMKGTRKSKVAVAKACRASVNKQYGLCEVPGTPRVVKCP